MPRKTLNINDFSGGIVKNKNPRDIQDNECQSSDHFVSFNPGELSVVAGFEAHPGFENFEGGYGVDSTAINLRTTWLIEPEYGFRRFLIVYLESTDSTDVLVTAKGLDSFVNADDAHIKTINHGLSSGLRVAVVRQQNTNAAVDGNQQYARIKRVNATQFKIPDLGQFEAMSKYALLAIESTIRTGKTTEIATEAAIRTTSVGNNRYILKTFESGIFGFYNVGSQGAGFYGGQDFNEYPGCHGEDPWLFDTQYLWDWNQSVIDPDSNYNIPFDIFRVKDAFYDNGHFRVLIEKPTRWAFGFCKRPVSFINFKDKNNFAPNSSNDTVGDINYGNFQIQNGWYPLRSHCLPPAA